MIGQYKGIFHSTLAKEGEVTITVRSDIKKSKTAGKPDFVVINHKGDDQFLNIENDAYRQLFSGKNGQTLTVKAIGDQHHATIDLVSQGEFAAPTTSEPIDPDIILAKHEKAYIKAMESADTVLLQTGKTVDPAQYQAMCSIFYGVLKDNQLIKNL